MDTQQLTSTDGPVREVPEPEVEVSWVADGVDGNDGGPTDLEAGLMLLEANHRATLARMRENIEIGDRRQEQLEQKLQEVCPSWIDDSSAVQQQWHELESESEEFHKRDESKLAKFHCRCLFHLVEGSTCDTTSIGERSSLGLAMEDKSNHLVGTYSPILKCSSSGDDQLSFETSRGEDLRLLGLFNDLTVGCHIRPETEKIQTLPAIPLLHPTRTAQHHKPKTPQSVSTSSKQSTRSNSLDSLYDLYNPTSLSLSKQFGPIIITREQMGPETGQWVTVREGENSYHDHRPLQETNSDVSELDITTCTPAKHWASSTRQATCGKAIHDDYNDDEVTPKAQRMHPTCWEYTRDTNNDTGLDADRDRRVSEEKERESDGLRALSASVDLDGEGGVSLLLAEDPKG